MGVGTMPNEEIQFTIRCAFCGVNNTYTKDELFDRTAPGAEVYREKYCLECGENITFICPVCNRGFPMDLRLREDNPVKIMPSFWEPLHSFTDDFIPLLESKFGEYWQIAEKLSAEFLRSMQSEFLKLCPELKGKLESLEKSFNQPVDPVFQKALENESKEIRKSIKKIFEELADIQENIIPETKLLKEKKEQSLRKHIPFREIIEPFQVFLTKLKSLRKDQIQRELDALKPGAEKVKDYICNDITFFKTHCPVCASHFYFLDRQIFLVDKNTHQLKFLKALSSQQNTQKVGGMNCVSVRIDITVLLVTEKSKTLHGVLRLNLNEGQPEVIGRNLIREAEYQESDVEQYLYGEDDPFKFISNSQLTLMKQGKEIVLKGKDYDPDRPGTFLGSMNTDIRQQYPNGVAIKSGDIIIIPLTNEADNSNKIELRIEKT